VRRHAQERHGPRARRGGPRRLPRDQARPSRLRPGAEDLLVPVQEPRRRDPGVIRIVVTGGAGAMGRIAVRGLAETAARGARVVVAARTLAEARRVTRGLGRRVRAVATDVTDPAALAAAVNGASVIVNTCHHAFNLRVMDAALLAGSHYCDLGGLFHMTRPQLARDAEFPAARRPAICRVRSPPGLANVLARAGAHPRPRG